MAAMNMLDRSPRLWQIGVVMVLAALVLGVYGVGAALLLDPGRAGATRSPVRIVSPPDGALLMAGQTLRVQAEVSGLAATRFELWDGDDAVTATDEVVARGAVVTGAHEWRATVPGTYQLSVHAVDAGAQVRASAPLTVFVAPRGQLIYASNRAGRYQLYTMLANGEGTGTLIESDRDEREPAYGPAGTLAFVTRDTAGAADIWLGRMSGPAWAFDNLTSSPANRAQPALTVQGDALAFVDLRSGVGELYAWVLNGGAPRRIVSGFEEIAHPSWSPDGSRIAFIGRAQRNADIYVVNRDGSNIRRLTSEPSQESQPAWSPTGAGIAFVSNRAGANQIYVMLPDGTRQTPLTTMASGAEQPAWSPDGFWLAFVANTGFGPRLDARELYLMRSDGTDIMRLTRNAYDDTDPAWVP
ncbi:MAG: PD40 domain-containing protein [Chloroflexi bacterium]|nr:PD40 domain-containing protein [Chloroflexota bacterium]